MLNIINQLHNTRKWEEGSIVRVSILTVRTKISIFIHMQLCDAKSKSH